MAANDRLLGLPRVPLSFADARGMALEDSFDVCSILAAGTTNKGFRMATVRFLRHGFGDETDRFADRFENVCVSAFVAEFGTHRMQYFGVLPEQGPGEVDLNEEPRYVVIDVTAEETIEPFYKQGYWLVVGLRPAACGEWLRRPEGPAS